MADTATAATPAAATPPPAATDQAQVQAPAVQETKTKKGKQVTGNIIVDTAAKIENLSKTQALALADELVDNAEITYFQLGGAFCVIDEQKWYDGFESFGDFVAKKYGFQERKARYWMSIYKNLTNKSISFDKVKGLGWTKLAHLAPILTPENVDEWVAKAAPLSVLDLLALMKGQKPEGEAGAKTSSDTTTLKFKFKNDQLATVQSAISKCKAETSTEYDNVAVEHVCAAYLAGTTQVQIPQKDLATLMAETGWEKSLEIFGEKFPKVDLNVTVNE